MNAPARIGSIVGMALLCSLACRGDLVVNWLDEPLWLNADPPPIIGQPDRHDIDLDGNGTIDFSFSGIWHISVDFRSENSNRYLIVPDPPPNTGGAVAALEAGFMIGAESGDGSLDWFGDDYDYWSTLMLNLDTGEAGEFWGQRAYIGVEFQRDDGVHYGWFDVEGGASGPYAVIRGWAYERQAKKPIHAGELPSVANSFDGDHKSDLCLYYPPEGLWHFSLSSGGVLTKHFGFAGANPITGDFDGDGKDDYGCYDAEGHYGQPPGSWYFMQSTEGFVTRQFGYAGTVPVTGDFDGDGKDDYGCYDAEGHYGQPAGSWYLMQSKDGFRTEEFGYAGTVPVVGDFDGDGTDDYGCYDAIGRYGQSRGSWYLMQSTDGFTTETFGYAGTVPFTGDFDGDGKCDYGCYDAVGRYRQPAGSWYFIQSTAGFVTKTFGYAGTVPVVGDFDGDGKCDYGCYDASGNYGQPPGSWYLMQSTAGFETKTFGYAGTVPVGAFWGCEEDITPTNALPFWVVLGHSYIDSMFQAEEVIRSQQEWNAFWSPSAVPSVNISFEEEMLIVVALGARGSSGYSVEVDSITFDDNRIIVEYTETVFSGGCLDVITFPCQVVRTERYDVPVSFVKSMYQLTLR